jgi:hypothetical protein
LFARRIIDDAFDTLTHFAPFLIKAPLARRIGLALHRGSPIVIGYKNNTDIDEWSNEVSEKQPARQYALCSRCNNNQNDEPEQVQQRRDDQTSEIKVDRSSSLCRTGQEHRVQRGQPAEAVCKRLVGTGVRDLHAIYRCRSAGVEGPMPRPVKRPAAQMYLNLLLESTGMSKSHPSVVDGAVEPNNSIDPTIRAYRSLVLFLTITPFHNNLRGKLGEAVIASR